MHQLAARIKRDRHGEEPGNVHELGVMKDNPRIVIEKLDVTDHPDGGAGAKYKDQPIDLLLSNAGKNVRYSSAFADRRRRLRRGPPELRSMPWDPPHRHLHAERGEVDEKRSK